MEKSEICLLLAFETFPVLVHLVQEDGCTDHIGHDEWNGAVDGAVNVGFSCEMDDAIGVEVLDD